MGFFKQHLYKRLYLAAQDAQNPGFLAFITAPNIPDPPEQIDLDPALHDEALGGSFVFSAAAPNIASAADAERFVGKIDAVLQKSPASRAFLWLMDPLNIAPETAPLLGLSVDGKSVIAGMLAPLTSTLNLEVQNGMRLVLNGETLQIEGTTGPQIRFAGLPIQMASIVTSGSLAFTGPLRCCIQFSIYVQRQALYGQFNWGFQFLFPIEDPIRPAISEWLPLASSNEPNATDMIWFSVSIDPSDVFNAALDPCADLQNHCPVQEAYDSRRTFFSFRGKNRDDQPTILCSYYRTIYGDRLNLLPVAEPGQGQLHARLVFARGERISEGAENFQLGPEGDFVLQLESAVAGDICNLLGGLQGAEFFSFEPKSETYAGDRLRFLSRQPAYAPKFPFPQASSVGPPTDPTAALLNKQYMTSWGSVRRASTQGNIHYVAQPKGASLFGRDELINKTYPDLFGHMDPGCTLSGETDLLYPLPPYAGISGNSGHMSQQQTEDFEREALAPTRRNAIGAATKTFAPSAGVSLQKSRSTEDSKNFTTPVGLIATLAGSDQTGWSWTKILLGQNTELGLRQMYFADPNAKLQQAFQTSDLFLVVANATNLGKLIGGASEDGQAFYNQMNIEDWILAAKVGQTNRYNDYNDILIVKGRKGKLFDPDGAAENSLVANPEKWTQSADFASPTTPDAPQPDSGQLVILSQWLQKFFKDAGEQKETEYFEQFNTIAKDENWTGILILNMHIEQLPKDLAGLTAGITQPQAFKAHHFAIEISQVKTTVEIAESSSMFGLIYYIDPDFTETDQDAQPVPPAMGVDYDFRLLVLKVLFQNSSVKRFQSYAQITLNKLFDMPVSKMGAGGNPYNTIVLRGSYQNNNGEPVYSLGAITDNSFYFDSNVINKVEVTSAQMSTRNAETAGTVVSWFGLTGYLDLKIVSSDKGEFDVFSFGNKKDEDALRKGLSFSDLGLRMSFSAGNTADRTFQFVIAEMRFDLATSTPRDKSLFVNFALELQGIQGGGQDTPPSGSGYLTVVTDSRFSGVDGGPWYGLVYQLNMGSPGNLVAGIGLKSLLLTAWSPDSSGESGYDAVLGLKLPGTGGGAKLISLQNVLKLSIGQLRLTFDYSKNSFLLLLTDIALKFLGLLKLPTGGSTLFYLFGNPQSQGKPSGLGWFAKYPVKKATLAQKAGE